MVAVSKDILFGVHSVAVLDRSNGYLPYTDGLFEIVGNVNANFSYEQVNLMGGSNPFPFATESGAASSEITLTVRQMNQGLLEAASSALTNVITASTTSGTIGTAVNTKGTSCISATTGVASVTGLSGSEANLKNGLYMIKVMSATTVNIYAATNIDNLVGTDVEFQDTNFKLLASNLTITASTATNVASLGIKLTGGSGTIGMTTNDVAIFEVAPAHQGIKEYSVGLSGNTPPYVGLYFVTGKQADGTVGTFFFPKVKLNGVPVNIEEKQFANFEISGTAIRTTDPFNTAQEIVYRAKYVKGNTSVA